MPIVLVRIDETEDLEIVRELVRAHEYWRMKRLAVDLVILNERPPSYHQDLQSALEGLVRTSQRDRLPTGKAHVEMCSCCAPTWCRPSCEVFCRPRRERCC